MSSCIPLKVDGQAALLPLLDCLADIKAWLGANFLNLNESKTEAIVFGKISPAFYTDALGPLASNIRPSVRNLGVIFDSAFKFQQQVSAVVRKSFFHLRTLAKVTYLSDILHHHIPSRALRSADQLLLEVPRTRQKTRGDRAFAVAAPRLWNCLPLHIRAAQSLNDFKSHLKTHLFSLAFD